MGCSMICTVFDTGESKYKEREHGSIDERRTLMAGIYVPDEYTEIPESSISWKAGLPPLENLLRTW